MNKYIKSFLYRGLIFGGFGPIITGIIFLFISKVEQISLSGIEVFIAIISTYLLAFVHAGASIFNQIEEWSLLKSTAFHLISLYVVYVLCYIVNSWIPFSWVAILIFTLGFILVYLIIWLTVVIIIKETTKQMNQKIAK